ncbi:hypothetical protein [Enterococcus sp. AZ103]|uniref:hypothetical protein n=1 Tax=Enterococcus sp. AZ103 TaxID=2774628 RepID=UPI003F253ECB
MKEGQKFKLIKWNKQLISVATGILLVSQLTVGPVQVLAETTDSALPSSSKNIDPENQLDVGMSSELFTAENQISNGNTGGESQASTDSATTRNNLSPQNDTITTQGELQKKIDEIDGSGTIILSNNIDISAKTIDISGKDITLISTDDATLKRVTNYFGSVFNVTNSGSLTLNGVSVDGNIDNKGTAGSSLISLNIATFTLESGTIKNGNSSNDGGAISTLRNDNNNTININGGTISDNTATRSGGGIFIDRGAVTVSGGTISNNTTADGGGICALFETTVIVSGNGIISDNTATSNGGGIYGAEGTVTVSGNGTISGNKSTNGGGIYFSGSNTNHNEVIIESGTISNNTATANGGGIYLSSFSNTSTVNIEGGTISNNTAIRDGGGVFIRQGTVTMTGGLIYGVADAAMDLVYYSTGVWSGPTDSGAVIAKSTSNSSPYEWGSDTDLNEEFGQGILSEKPYWTIKGDAVGIGSSISSTVDSFIPVSDAQIQFKKEMLNELSKSPLTYTGKEQSIGFEVADTYKDTDLASAITREIVPTYQHQTNNNEISLLNAGTYNVTAGVTTAEEPATKLLNGSGVDMGTVTINPAKWTQEHFNYAKETNLTYTGTGLKAVITAKNPTVITDFSVRYIKDDDPSNKELTEMTEAGTYSIRIKINTDTNSNYNTPAAFTLSDAKVIVKESEKKQPEATMYGATIPTSYVYDGKAPEIAISSKGEDLGTISPIFKQNDVEVKSSNVGTYQVYARNTGSDKYNAADTMLGEFTITAKPLTISVEDVEVQKNDLLPEIIINYTDFAEGEDENTIFSELPTGEYVGDSSKVGKSAIKINKGTKKAAADNYELTYQSGTLTVLENPEEDRVPLYRVYNKNNGEHLYTSSQSEAQGLVNKGWQDEGIGWYGAKTSNKPVYRLYNKNSGEHFYTLDKAEYNSVANAGWEKEDISFYAAEDTEIPIYRVFNPNSKDAGSHLYTLSTDENTWLIQEGWKSEGVGFYGK